MPSLCLKIQFFGSAGLKRPIDCNKSLQTRNFGQTHSRLSLATWQLPCHLSRLSLAMERRAAKRMAVKKVV